MIVRIDSRWLHRICGHSEKRSKGLGSGGTESRPLNVGEMAEKPYASASGEINIL